MKEAVERVLREEVGVGSGDRILVGVSGGCDSVALLHLLHALAPDFPFELHAAHLDHALRVESADDARFVAALCADLAVPLAIRRVDVLREARERKAGVEEAARSLRRRFLEFAAAELGCRWIALGHHRGDQAETVLHRFLRGTSLPGLAGMRFVAGSYIRPLLGSAREQILRYATDHGLPFVEDASNRDPRFTRNRLRHELLPALQSFNPRIEEHLARLGRRAALEEDYWRGIEEQALTRLAEKAGEEEVLLDGPGLMALHPALRLRVIRRGLEALRGDLGGIDAVHLEAVEGLLLGARPQAEVHLPGMRACRRYGELRLRCTPLPEALPFSLVLREPGELRLPDGRHLRAEVVGASGGEGPSAVEFDAEAVSFPLEIRSFRPGDVFRPEGSAGRRKLKRFFIDAKSLPKAVAPFRWWFPGGRFCGWPGCGAAMGAGSVEMGQSFV